MARIHMGKIKLEGKHSSGLRTQVTNDAGIMPLIESWDCQELVVKPKARLKALGRWFP